MPFVLSAACNINGKINNKGYRHVRPVSTYDGRFSECIVGNKIFVLTVKNVWSIQSFLANSCKLLVKMVQ